MKLSTVILAKTSSAELFEMTLNAVHSLLDADTTIEHEIILVESNPNYRIDGFEYPKSVKVIVPNQKFNFHKFLNFGIQQASGDFIALCNNDLIFNKNWFAEILKIAQAHPHIDSFSPSDDYSNTQVGFEIGYKVITHIKGWCLVFKKELINKIGPLDDTFDFYFADNDYALTLLQYNIEHALVFSSKVEHLAKKSTQKSYSSKEYLAHYTIPNYLYNCDYTYVLEDELSLSGFLKYQNKWGSPNLIYKKKKIALLLMKYKLGFLNRYFLRIKF